MKIEDKDLGARIKQNIDTIGALLGTDYILDRTPEGVTFEQVPFSSAYRVRVLLHGQTVTCLHRIDPEVEKGTAQLPDVKKAPSRK